MKNVPLHVRGSVASVGESIGSTRPETFSGRVTELVKVLMTPSPCYYITIRLFVACFCLFFVFQLAQMNISHRDTRFWGRTQRMCRGEIVIVKEA